MVKLFDIYNNEDYEFHSMKTFISTIDFKYLPFLICNNSGFINSEVAKIIDKKYLVKMANDPSSSVRYEVAIRIDKKYLQKMMNNDISPYIRRTIEMRMEKIKNEI